MNPSPRKDARPVGAQKPATNSAGFRKMRDIQRAFAAVVMRPLTSDQKMEPVAPDGRPTQDAVAEFIRPNDRLTSFERIEIYNKQYWFRLLDSLYEDFPGLRTLIGDERFHDMSIAYLDRNPSNSFTLRDLGDRLEQFLVREPQWIAPHERLARDILRLEWAHIVAFDGDELPPLEIDALLEGADPATLRLRLQPHLTLLACDYPVDEYVLAVRRRQEPRGEASNAVAERLPRQRTKKIKLPPQQKTYLAVHRSEFSVWYKTLEPDAYRLCVALGKGLTLQEACERALGRRKMPEDFAQKLQGWFRQWAEFGWFCRGE